MDSQYAHQAWLVFDETISSQHPSHTTLFPSSFRQTMKYIWTPAPAILRRCCLCNLEILQAPCNFSLDVHKVSWYLAIDWHNTYGISALSNSTNRSRRVSFMMVRCPYLVCRWLVSLRLSGYFISSAEINVNWIDSSLMCVWSFSWSTNGVYLYGRFCRQSCSYVWPYPCTFHPHNEFWPCWHQKPCIGQHLPLQAYGSDWGVHKICLAPSISHLLQLIDGAVISGIWNVKVVLSKKCTLLGEIVANWRYSDIDTFCVGFIPTMQIMNISDNREEVMGPFI